MKLRIHTCKATGCQHVVSIRMLMCLDHWRMVPAPLQREVLATNRALRVNPRDLVAARDYQDAVRQAVAAVEEKQERKAATGPSGSLFT